MSLIYTAPLEGGSTTTTTTSTSILSSKRRNSVYLGSKSDAKDRSKLDRFGITHILNVTPEKEAGIKAGVANFFEKKKLYTYRRISVYDNATSDLLQHAPSIVSFISNALHYGSVLVHCQRGVSRSTTCVVFYLMNRVGMDLDGALALVKRRRPIADPIPAFVEQLRRYEGQCHGLGLIRKKKEEDENGGDDKGALHSGNGGEITNSGGVSNVATATTTKSDESSKRKGEGEVDDTNLKKRKAENAQTIIGPCRGPVGPQRQQKAKKIHGPSRAPCIGPTLPPSCKTKDAGEKREDE